MPDVVEVRIDGIDRIDAALREVPLKLARNIMRGALRAAGKVIADQVKETVPVRRGALRDSVKVSSRIKDGMPKAAVKFGNRKAFYARFIERGTKAHEIRPAGAKSLYFAGIYDEIVRHPGAEARRTVQRAVDTRREDATAALIAYAQKRLANEGIDLPDTEPEDPEI